MVKKYLSKLYDWLLHWAKTPYGPIALFVLAFAESSFFPVPADPLLMALCLGKVKRSMYYVFMCTLGSVLGGIFGFIIGYFLWYTPSGELTGVGIQLSLDKKTNNLVIISPIEGTPAYAAGVKSKDIIIRI